MFFAFGDKVVPALLARFITVFYSATETYSSAFGQ
jgi:hypothetical protein